MSIDAHPEFKDIEGPQLLVALELMYFVAKSDGFLAADELRAFLKVAGEMSGDKFSSSHLSRLVSSWGKREVVDIDARLEELKLSLGHKAAWRAAHGLARSMARADGVVLESESQMLDKIARIFELT
jgi:uncharacterized tellurite resistance protein B-like protein